MVFFFMLFVVRKNEIILRKYSLQLREKFEFLDQSRRKNEPDKNEILLLYSFSPQQNKLCDYSTHDYPSRDEDCLHQKMIRTV